jgi:hypothetical protein
MNQITTILDETKLLDVVCRNSFLITNEHVANHKFFVVKSFISIFLVSGWCLMAGLLSWSLRVWCVLSLKNIQKLAQGTIVVPLESAYFANL